MIPGGFDAEDERWMARALALAAEAAHNGETPVGAVVTGPDGMLGEGWNRPVRSGDPTAHAEMEAIRAAAARISNYRLPGTTLYVTLEPCAMCAGAIVTARVKRLVFGARDLRFGGVRSKFRLVDSGILNHSVQVDEGLMAAQAGLLLTEFFQKLRVGQE